jgi:hypothetical protein
MVVVSGMVGYSLGIQAIFLQKWSIFQTSLQKDTDKEMMF